METLGTPHQEETLETKEEITTPQNEVESETQKDVTDEPPSQKEEEVQEIDENEFLDNLSPYRDNTSESEPPMPEEQEQVVQQEEEASKEEQKGVLITKPLKYKGKEIYIDNEEEAIALMQKGLDYEMKMSKIKPLRGIAKIVEESGLTQEEIQALADAKKGKAEALEYLAKNFGLERISGEEDIDIFDDEPRKNNYKPEVIQDDPIKEILVDVNNHDPELYGRVVKTFEELDPVFQQELYQPNVFPLFVGSVATGEWDKTYPEAVKIKAVNPALSWLQAYQAALQKVVQPKQTKSEPPKQVKSKKPKKRTTTNKYEELWDKDLDELAREIGLE